MLQRLAFVVLAIVSGHVACGESAPSIRLRVDGVADPAAVRVQYMLAGPFGGYSTQLRGSANVDIPLIVNGQSAQSLRAIVFCPGYHSARVEVADVAAQTDLRVVLDALPVRRVTGTVEFVDGAQARSFVLEVDVIHGSSHRFFGIVDGAPTTFAVAKAVVSAQGVFSIVIADLAQDDEFRSPGLPSVFRFQARDAATGNFVFELKPGQVAIEDLPQALVLSASPAR